MGDASSVPHRPSLPFTNTSAHCELFQQLNVPQTRRHCVRFRVYQMKLLLECGPMPNLMVVLSNIGGALCSTPQSLADAHY